MVTKGGGHLSKTLTAPLSDEALLNSLFSAKVVVTLKCFGNASRATPEPAMQCRYMPCLDPTLTPFSDYRRRLVGPGDVFLHEALRWQGHDRMQPVQHLDPPVLRQDPQVQRPGDVHLPAVQRLQIRHPALKPLAHGLSEAPSGLTSFTPLLPRVQTPIETGDGYTRGGRALTAFLHFIFPPFCTSFTFRTVFCFSFCSFWFCA